MVKIVYKPTPISLLKASLVPLADHDGPSQSLRPFTIGVFPEPSAFMITMSHPACRLTYAIRFPSGDHAAAASTPGSVVSCCTLLPSAFMTKMSLFPVRLLPNVIFVPSGDHEG